MRPSISSTLRTGRRPSGTEDAESRERPDLTGPSADDPLKLYVRQIGDGRLLTPPEERELARRKDEGAEAAKRKLIESNLRVVMSITRNTRRPSSWWRSGSSGLDSGGSSSSANLGITRERVRSHLGSSCTSGRSLG